MKRVLLTFALIAFLLVACGPKAEPTMTAADVQGTAVAAAWTMVAATQAAIPTATPIPPTPIPTETPLPTSTVPVVLVPTQPVEIRPSPTTAASGDDCNHLLDPGAPGPTFPLKIFNETKAQITVSLYLEKTPFGECGYRSFQLGPHGDTVVTFPQGVIYAYAWINDPKKPTTSSGGPFKPNNTDKWSIYVRESTIVMKGP